MDSIGNSPIICLQNELEFKVISPEGQTYAIKSLQQINGKRMVDINFSQLSSSQSGFIFIYLITALNMSISSAQKSSLENKLIKVLALKLKKVSSSKSLNPLFIRNW